MNKLARYAANLLVPSILVNLWLMVRYRCVIHPGARILFPANVRIGEGSMIGKCTIVGQGPIRIGRKCFINDHAILNAKTGYIEIGDQTSINHYSVVFGNGGVEIGRHCAIGLNVQIVKNHLVPPDRGDGYPHVSEQKTTIGDSVWLCSNVVVVDGVTIGSHAVVGAQSLVTKDIAIGAIAVGTPARAVKKRNEPGQNDISSEEP